MKTTLWSTLLLSLLLSAGAPAQETISHGRFKDVKLYRPAAPPTQFVLLLSGDGGWDRHAAIIAQTLVERGAMIVGISTPQLLSDLEADGADCVFPDGDLENLAHYVQGYARLPTYRTPLLVGYASGASLAYAMIAQAPSGTFAGAISLQFCPELRLRKPLCRDEGLNFTERGPDIIELLPAERAAAPWIALHGDRDARCDAAAVRRFATQADAQFVLLPGVGLDYAPGKTWQPQLLAAYDRLAANNAPDLPAAPTSLRDLPLVEVRADSNGDLFAILLSGDGGWAGLDKHVAAAFVARGIPVAGLDSLRYFWSARTPEGVASDLDRMLRYYSAHWRKPRAVLIGYSQGADVLPFAVNRLPAPSRGLVTLTVLMSPGKTASFEFHLGNWLGAGRDGKPVLPETQKLRAATTLCLYGSDDKDSLCREIAAANAQVQSLPGGHHFDGAYYKLAELILARTAPQ